MIKRLFSQYFLLIMNKGMQLVNVDFRKVLNELKWESLKTKINKDNRNLISNLISNERNLQSYL